LLLHFAHINILPKPDTWCFCFFPSKLYVSIKFFILLVGTTVTISYAVQDATTGALCRLQMLNLTMVCSHHCGSAMQGMGYNPEEAALLPSLPGAKFPCKSGYQKFHKKTTVLMKNKHMRKLPLF